MAPGHSRTLKRSSLQHAEADLQPLQPICKRPAGLNKQDGYGRTALEQFDSDMGHVNRHPLMYDTTPTSGLSACASAMGGAYAHVHGMPNGKSTASQQPLTSCVHNVDTQEHLEQDWRLKTLLIPQSVYGRLGDNFFEMTIWATRLGDSSCTFERQASRRLGDKNEALRQEQPQSEGRVSDYQYLVASGIGMHISKVH